MSLRNLPIMSEAIQLFSMDRRIQKYQETFEFASQRVLRSKNLIQSEENTKFENEFADFLKIKNVISVANGTDALCIAIASLKLPEFSLIGLASNGGGYSTNAILRNNFVPLFADINPHTLNLDLETVKDLINNGAAAIVITHLFGQINPEIEAISKLCEKSEVKLIEDCAQSHGAVLNNSLSGTFGDISCFSFYPTKNLGAFGDAGAIATKSTDLAGICRSLRSYGWRIKYEVELEDGLNSRMDELQAAFLRDILIELPAENATRVEIARLYSREIMNSKIGHIDWNFESFNAHLFIIKSKSRENLIRHLQKRKVATGIHYPIPDHCQLAWRNKHRTLGSLKTVESLAGQILTIPCHPYMTQSEITRVIDALNSF